MIFTHASTCNNNGTNSNRNQHNVRCLFSLRLVDALCFVHVVADGACGEVHEYLYICVHVYMCVCVHEMLRSSDLDWCNTCFRFIRICFHGFFVFIVFFFLIFKRMKCIYFSIFWCIIFLPISIQWSNFKYTRTISNEIYR